MTAAVAAERLRVRRLREQLNAVSEYVGGLYAPVQEDYRDAPMIVRDCFDGLLGTLDEFDRQLAKLDGGSEAVGGQVALAEKWASGSEVSDG